MVSFTHTFLAVFFGSMMLELTNGTLPDSREVLAMLCLASFRTAIKAAWNQAAGYHAIQGN